MGEALEHGVQVRERRFEPARLAGALLLWIVVLAGTAPPAPALDYTRLKLFELCTLAEQVVVGRIVDLDSENFEVEVVERIVGADVPAKLEIPRFRNWTCAGRWTEYAVGQEVVLFLWSGFPVPGETPLRGGPPRIMGGGGEGEMPRSGDRVFLRGFRVRDLAYEGEEYDGRRAEGTWVSIEDLTLAVRRLRSRTSWGKDGGSAIHGEIRWTVDPLELEQFAKSSELARHLVEEVISSGKFVGDRVEPRPAIQPPPLPLARSTGESDGGPPDFMRTSRQMTCARLGDLDGDGREEWVVGSEADCAEGNRFGALWILFLTAEGAVRASVELSDHARSFPASMNEFARLGQAIEPLGDLDGDGIPDLAVSAPLWNWQSEEEGGVWILFLERTGHIRSSVEIGAELRARLPQGREELGKALACLGDIDGDGTLELAIGVRVEADGPVGGRRDNRVLVTSIADDGSVREVRSIHATGDGFAGPYNWFGDGLAAPGDVNGDGVPDLAIGDPYDPDGGHARGCIWIVFLDRDAKPIGRQKVSDWAGGFEGLLLDRAALGSHLVGPGDLDGDGVPDLLATSSAELWALFLRRDGSIGRSVSTGRAGGGFVADVTPTGGLAAGRPIEADGTRRVLLTGRSGDRYQFWLLDLLPDGTFAAR